MATRAILLLLLCISSIYAYQQGDPVSIYYNKIFSLKSPLTYTYQSLGFVCPSTHTARKKNLLVFDQDFRGDRLVQSDYKINFLENQDCKLLCKQSLGVEHAIEIQDLIADEYSVEWELDGMPGATVSYTNEAPEHSYKIGFPLGFKKGENTFLNNHVIFQILYTPIKDQFGKYDIIGFEIYPDSIAEGECAKKNIDYEYQEITGRRTQVSYTYSVQWKEIVQPQPTKLWDTYLLKPNAERHEQSIKNGLVIVSLEFFIIVFILFKTRNSGGDDDADDFIGWKLVNRDVFRRPVYGGLLTPIMGGGIQLVIVALGLLVSLQMSWYHPAQPGSLVRWFTVFFLVGSVPSGYCSARMYKVYRGKSWVLNSLLTASIVPCALLSVVFISTLIIWFQQSSLGISFSGWVSLLSVWLFGLVPLTGIGAYYGEKVDRIEYPSRTTQIPRMIPRKRWYKVNALRVIFGGIVPFSIVFLDWNEFLMSMNRGEYTLSIEYLMYISVLVLICTAEMTIVLIFLQLCTEDYHWWWQSFMIGSSVSAYMFGYGIFFLFYKTDIQGLVGCTVYALNLLLGCSLVGLCTGTLGFMCSFKVIKKIYSSSKKD